jgi:polar amino acid transport system substrate-binding protein
MRFLELSWEQLPEALLAGKIDIIMSGMSITAARQVRMDFARPYLRAGQVALVRREDLGKLQ